MRENFDASLAAVLEHEGGWSNDPKDPGGATMHGITQREYDGWRSKHLLLLQSVRLISDLEVEAVYSTDYWMVCSCNDLPSGIDYATFDFAVNSGTVRAAHYLQLAAGVIADGKIGPRTIAACVRADRNRLIAALCAERQTYLEHLATFGHFGDGWTERVSEVEAQAKEMAA